DQRVAALRERIGDQVLELARLVAAKSKSRVAVVALGPQRGTPELRAQPFEAVDRRRPEKQRLTGIIVERHGSKILGARNREPSRERIICGRDGDPGRSAPALTSLARR